MEGVFTTFYRRRDALRADPLGFVTASACLRRDPDSVVGNKNSATEFFGRRKKPSTRREIISQKHLPLFGITWQYLFRPRGREEVWPWLERSAAVFYFLRLLVVALLRLKNFLARC